jgi:hypothetical protein
MSILKNEAKHINLDTTDLLTPARNLWGNG